MSQRLIHEALAHSAIDPLYDRGFNPARHGYDGKPNLENFAR
jgi:hypothetical protein